MRVYYGNEISLPLRFLNPRRRVARATEFCNVAPNICGWSVLNKLHVNILSPRRLRWVLDYVENLGTFALPCSQEHATCPYVEPNQSSPSLQLIPRRSTLILSSHLPSRSSKHLLPLRFPYQKIGDHLVELGVVKKLHEIYIYI